MCPPKRCKSSLNNTASQQFHLGPSIGTSLTTTNPILLISKESGANFVLELARIGSDDGPEWKADAGCSIIRGVTKLPDEGGCPCPRSHLTSSSPSGNS